MALTRREFLAVPPLAAASSVLAASSVPAGPAPAQPPAAAGIDWAALRADLTVEPGVAYFNWGTYGPPARAVADAQNRDRDTMRANYNRHFATHFPAASINPLVDAITRFLGADRDTFAFASGATEAMNVLAGGLALEAGDEVLTTEHEHQAGIYPFLLRARRHGVRVRQIPMPPALRSAGAIVDHLEAAMTPRTKVLSFCHIQYTDGLVLPTRAICDMARRRGVISIVDGAQAVGMIDVNIRDLGCDCYAASLHKWLGSPYGTGFFTIRQDLQDRVWPAVVEAYEGWDTKDRYGTTNPGVDFAAGWPEALLKYCVNFRYYAPEFWAVPAAIQRHEQIGRPALVARMRTLVARLRTGLQTIPGVEIVTPESPDLSGGLVAFRKTGADHAAVFFALSRQDRVIIRPVRHAGIRFDVLRASVHAFNTEDEVDRLIETLRRRL